MERVVREAIAWSPQEVQATWAIVTSVQERRVIRRAIGADDIRAEGGLLDFLRRVVRCNSVDHLVGGASLVQTIVNLKQLREFAHRRVRDALDELLDKSGHVRGSACYVPSDLERLVAARAEYVLSSFGSMGNARAAELTAFLARVVGRGDGMGGGLAADDPGLSLDSARVLKELRYVLAGPTYYGLQSLMRHAGLVPE
jgi:hypothetical protein